MNRFIGFSEENQQRWQGNDIVGFGLRLQWRSQDTETRRKAYCGYRPDTIVLKRCQLYPPTFNYHKSLLLKGYVENSMG
jgi:hypothetical protein